MANDFGLLSIFLNLLRCYPKSSSYRVFSDTGIVDHAQFINQSFIRIIIDSIRKELKINQYF